MTHPLLGVVPFALPESYFHRRVTNVVLGCEILKSYVCKAPDAHMMFELFNVENGPVGWLSHAVKVWAEEQRHLDLKITFGWICTRLTQAKLLKLLALS